MPLRPEVSDQQVQGAGVTYHAGLTPVSLRHSRCLCCFSCHCHTADLPVCHCCESQGSSLPHDATPKRKRSQGWFKVLLLVACCAVRRYLGTGSRVPLSPSPRLLSLWMDARNACPSRASGHPFMGQLIRRFSGDPVQHLFPHLTLLFWTNRSFII